jgi:hypothetical protein
MHPPSLMSTHCHPSRPFHHTALWEVPAQLLRSFYGTQFLQVIGNQGVSLPVLPTEKLLRTFEKWQVCQPIAPSAQQAYSRIFHYFRASGKYASIRISSRLIRILSGSGAHFWVPICALPYIPQATFLSNALIINSTAHRVTNNCAVPQIGGHSATSSTPPSLPNC